MSLSVTQRLRQLKTRLTSPGPLRAEGRWGLLFISPWLIGFLLFKCLPILASFALSFIQVDLLHPAGSYFIGLQNYRALLTDRQAVSTLVSTLNFALVAIPAQLLTALALATLLNSPRLRARPLLRTLLFLPSIIPGPAIVFIWSGFLDPTSGWLNRLLLQPLGLPPSPLAYSPGGYTLFRALAALWSIGPGLLIMLGAMHGIPAEFYEAAKVDGAGRVRRFINVTLPLISPAIFFSLVINLIAIFGGAPLLEQSNPLDISVSAYNSLIYTIIFRQLDLDYAASLAWVLFGLMLAVVIALFSSARYWVYYADET